MHGEAHSCLDGIGQYCRNLNQALRAHSLHMELFNFVPAGQSRQQEWCVGSYPIQGAQALLGMGGFEKMHQFVQHKELALVHSTDHLVPKMRGVPVLATVMDALPLSHPQWVDYRLKSLKNAAWRRSVQWADHVVTISNFSKGELIRWFRLQPDRVSVVPLGVDTKFFIRPALPEMQTVLSKYGLQSGYVLVLGTLQPRKNIEGAIHAHNKLPLKLKQQHPLVVIGRAGWDCQSAIQALTRAGPNVQWLQRVSDNDIYALMHGASVLLALSHYEGFGLPVLEAFASQVPVVAVESTAMPEVAGNAALLVKPGDTQEAADALLALLTQPDLVIQCTEAGLAKAKSSLWKHTAEATANIYRKLQ